MSTIRWLLVLPIALIGFYLSFFGAILSKDFFKSVCLQLDSSAIDCSSRADGPASIIGALLAPVLVGVFSVLMAPHRNRMTIWGLYVLGLLAAIWLCSRAMPGLVLLAGISGALTAYALQHRFARRAVGA